jgi:hypothetical protein
VKPGGALRRRLLFCAAVAVWLCLVFAGTAALMGYKNAAGAQLDAPSRWPDDSRLPRVSGQATLVMAAHPHCPCTRASLTELERLLSRTPGRMHAVLLFVRPQGAPSRWEDTDLWRRASSMAGVQTVSDPGGAEARRFHALTSGQTALYAPDGELLFSGGITAARGHEGDSVGRAYILAALEGTRLPHPNAPVFGCALDSPDDGGKP